MPRSGASPRLARSQALYRGRAEAGRYLDELRSGGMSHRARIREIRRMGADRFALLVEVLVEGQVLSSGATMVRLKGSQIIEAAVYLSDEETLVSLGIIPNSAEGTEVAEPEAK
jgi:hypothetical protein